MAAVVKTEMQWNAAESVGAVVPVRAKDLALEFP